jgi:rsbT co-antagonist protein RsbR
VAHLREHRTTLRQDWAGRIQESGLLLAMTAQEMAAETTSVYDNYVEVLETGSVEALQRYARDLSERIIPRRAETHEVVGIVLVAMLRRMFIGVLLRPGQATERRCQGVHG